MPPRHIQLEIKSQPACYSAMGIQTTALKTSMPFLQTKPGMPLHRVRSGILFWNAGRYSHTAVHLWCGTGAFPGSSKKRREARFRAGPATDEKVCTFCEARATAAGKPTSETLAGHPVTLGTSRPPRKPRLPC